MKQKLLPPLKWCRSCGMSVRSCEHLDPLTKSEPKHHRCHVCKKLLKVNHFVLWTNYPKKAIRFHLECADKFAKKRGHRN